jgi:hypothetical protein
MALTHRVTTSVRSNAGTVSAVTGTFTGTAETNVEETLGVGTDTAVAFAADVSAIKSIALLWEPTTGSSTCLVETNSGSAADDSITLVADKPLIWNTDILATLGTANPLTVDVTGLFVTTTAAGDLSIYCLVDATP